MKAEIFLRIYIFLVAFAVAAVVGVGVVLALLGLVLLHKDLLRQLTCEALHEIFLQVDGQRWAAVVKFLLI